MSAIPADGCGIELREVEVETREVAAVEVLEPIQVRLRNVLNVAYRGIYHASKIHKHNEGTPHEYWVTNHCGDLSTFDYDILTRLVIQAHDECVRVNISASGPRLVKITISARNGREGCFSEKHPTIERAIELLRTGKTDRGC